MALFDHRLGQESDDIVGRMLRLVFGHYVALVAGVVTRLPGHEPEYSVNSNDGGIEYL